jgi:hypothetical protein
MNAARLAAACVLAATCAARLAGAEPPSTPAQSTGEPFTASQRAYVLSCGGCHGLDGVSNAKLVPELHDQVGWFLQLPQGRDYLVRLPNVAFSMVADQELADLLNYMVFHIGGASVPAAAKPYTAAEVARLRKQPLTEVSLIAYRQQLVDTLITKHHAPASLRVYGNAAYTAAGSDR